MLSTALKQAAVDCALASTKLSPVFALKRLQAFAKDPGVWRDETWVLTFMAASNGRAARVSLVLRGLDQWCHRPHSGPSWRSHGAGTP